MHNNEDHQDIPKVRVFLSQPMSELTDEEVEETRRKAIEKIDEYFIDKNLIYEIVSTYYDKEAKDAEKMNHPSIYRWGHALMVLATCDYICFTGKWSERRGCVMEYIAAKLCNLNIIKADNSYLKGKVITDDLDVMVTRTTSIKL